MSDKAFSAPIVSENARILMRTTPTVPTAPLAIKPIRLDIPQEHWLPTYASDGASGFDLRAAIKQTILLYPRLRILIPCGFAVEIPPGFELQIRSRSGLAAKHGVAVLNSPGTIDSDYRGEVQVILHNTDLDRYLDITPGMRIAQAVLAPVIRAKLHITTTLTPTERGAGGMGSTGTT